MTVEDGRWATLAPDQQLVNALDDADAGQTYLLCADQGDVHAKRNWSNRFADACAHLIAPIVRQTLRDLGGPSDLNVYPEIGGTAERPVTLGEGSKKRIDVAVVHWLGGLRIDVSLKGMNFRGESGNYDHNLTGRTYELEDEIRVVRQRQPAAFVFALYWLPVLAGSDKAQGDSSLARTLLHLRARVHKGPPGTARDPDRLDGAGIALYAPVDTTTFGGEVIERGVLRCIDVLTDPPRRGRPQVETTVTLDDLVRAWMRLYLDATGVARPDWADPEPESPA